MNAFLRLFVADVQARVDCRALVMSFQRAELPSVLRLDLGAGSGGLVFAVSEQAGRYDFGYYTPHAQANPPPTQSLASTWSLSFTPLARFATREDAEQAKEAVRRAMLRCRGSRRTMGRAILFGLVAFVTWAVLGYLWAGIASIFSDAAKPLAAAADMQDAGRGRSAMPMGGGDMDLPMMGMPEMQSQGMQAQRRPASQPQPREGVPQPADQILHMPQ